MKKKSLLLFIIALISLSELSAQSLDDVLETAQVLYSSIPDDAKLEIDNPLRTRFSQSEEIDRGILLSRIDSLEESLNMFLKSFLSDMTFKKITRIFSSHDKSDFKISFYGEPSAQTPWGFSLDGPYLSLNITIYKNNFSYTPMMIGGETTKYKTEIREDDNMSVEEGIATDFMSMLNGKQLKTAITSVDSPKKIINSFNNELNYEQNGISFEQLEGENQTTFMTMLLSVYYGRVHEKLSKKLLARLSNYSVNQLKIEWKGDTTQDSEHYYKISSPTLIAEYVNLEKDKNHVISTFREKKYDFGLRFLPKKNSSNLNNDRSNKNGKYHRPFRAWVLLACVILICLFLIIKRIKNY